MGWTIGEGAKSLTRSTAQDGYESQIALQAPLNVATVSEDIQDLGTTAPHLLNNGICKDGGITEMYETDITQANATVCYTVSNGTVLKLKNIGSSPYATDVYVNDGVSDKYIGQTSSVFFNRSVINKNYLDVAISSDGTHGLGVWTDATNTYLDEFSLASPQTVTQTATLFATNCLFAAICRANTLTFASLQSTSGIVYGSPMRTFVYLLNGTSYTAPAATTGYPALFNPANDNVVSFFNGGTVLYTAPSGVSTQGVAPYASANWTIVNTTNTIFSIGTSQVQPLSSSQTSLILVGSQMSASAPTVKITVSSAGAVALASDAGNTYPVFGTTPAMSVAYTSPYGTSGLEKDTTGYACWVGSDIAYNSTASTSNVGQYVPELLAPVLVTLGPSSGISLALELKSYLGNAALICANQYPLIRVGYYATGMPLNDFGGGSFDTDLTPYLQNPVGTFQAPGIFWPFDYRSENGTGNGAWCVYRRNDHKYVACGLYYNAQQQFTEIGPGVVALNACISKNTIIDTNSLVGYENLSGYSNHFLFTFTSGALGYFRGYNKYSATLDAGAMGIQTALVSGSLPLRGIEAAASTYASYPLSYSVWNSSLAYVASVSTPIVGVPALSQWYIDPRYDATYVANQYVAPAGDAVWSKNQAGIQMLASSAIPQPNYFGYQISNLFSVRYSAFFILKGNYYAFDGVQIYIVPLANGPASTVAGPNYPLVAATGLQFLDAGQDYAFFLGSFDNSVWAFDGGRTIQKVVAFNQKPPIQSGVYNENENRLTLVTSSSVLSMWSDGTITENPLPFTGAFSTWSTQAGTYFVQGIVTKIRSYENLVPGTSTVIPLTFQSAYLGNGSDGQTITVNRVLVRVLYGSGAASPLTVTWYWLTPDGEGSNAYTVTPTVSAAGYAVLDLNPANNEVLGGSVGISTTDATQKITILEVVLYYVGSAEATASNHAQ